MDGFHAKIGVLSLFRKRERPSYMVAQIPEKVNVGESRIRDVW